MFPALKGAVNTRKAKLWNYQTLFVKGISQLAADALEKSKRVLEKNSKLVNAIYWQSCRTKAPLQSAQFT